MAENEFASGTENKQPALKEAVCIDAMRIYDSCSDKDCLEDMRVLFPRGGTAAGGQRRQCARALCRCDFRVHRYAADPLQPRLLLH